MTCPLCGRRKGKRVCPAKDVHICSSCCGSKRKVEIACPEDCHYLGGAHGTAWDGRETEKRRDQRRVGPHVAALSEAQRGLFLLALFGLQTIRERCAQLDDRLLADALTAFRKTVETRERGVLYEHAPADLRAQALMRDLEQLFQAEGRDGVKRAPADADLLAVLKAYETALTETQREDSAPTAFLDTAARLVADFVAAEPAHAEGAPEQPRLIVEP
jgi:hypothetical protein